MFGSLYTSVSGLRALADNLGSVGHNLANMGTYGYKASRLSFAEKMQMAMRGGRKLSTGSGVMVANKETDHSQGNLVRGKSQLDLAITGRGYFVYQDPKTGEKLLSRVGNLKTNSQGFLVNQKGMRMMAYNNGQLGPINMGSFRSIKAKPTLKATIDGNLDLTKAKSNGFLSDLELNKDALKDGKTFSVDIVDGQGVKRPVKVFMESSDQMDKVKVSVIDPKAEDGKRLLGSKLLDIKENKITGDLSGLELGGKGSGGHQFSLELGEFSTYTGVSELKKVTQDGFMGGELTNVLIDSMGQINFHFSNGEIQKKYTIAMGDVNSFDQLKPLNGGLYQAHLPSFNTAGKEGLGAIQAGFLESSNVDMGSQFVEMISTQQGFSANSKSIETADSITQLVTNLSR